MPKKVTEEQKKKNRNKWYSEYVKNNIRQVMVKFNLNNEEAELFNYLYSKDSMQGYIKNLIRKDMENKGNQ